MNKKNLKLSIIGVLLLSVISFAQTQTQDNNAKIIEEYTPKLQIEFVIQKAKEYALSQGQKLENYFIKSSEYDADKKEWAVFFEGKLPIPGNNFVIVVNDGTEKFEIFYGE